MMPSFQDEVIANQDFFDTNGRYNKLEKSVEQIERSEGNPDMLDPE
jgi:hypothetical protein